MLIRSALALASALSLGVAAPAAAQQASVLTPSGPWNVEYSPDSCVLARAFGDAASPVYLRLEQFEPGTYFEVSLVGSPLRSRKLTRDVVVSFGDQADLAPVELSALFGTSHDDTPALNFILDLRGAAGGDPSNLGELTAEEFAVLADLRVGISGEAAQVVLKSNGLKEALTAMKACMNALLKEWGTDPDTQNSLTQRVEPLGNPGKWMRPEDYPRGALRAGRSANIHFRLTVDKNGRVSDCAIQGATEGRDFVRRTCDLLKRRAMFQPALDEQGEPITSYYVNTMRWLMRPDDGKTRLSEQVFEDIR